MKLKLNSQIKLIKNPGLFSAFFRISSADSMVFPQVLYNLLLNNRRGFSSEGFSFLHILTHYLNEITTKDYLKSVWITFCNQKSVDATRVESKQGGVES